MDLDYIQKYQFSANGGSGGISLTDNTILSTSLLGGGNATFTFGLGIPGGLILSNMNVERYTNLEVDPWEVAVKDDFDSLLNLVSAKPSKIGPQNKTKKNTSSLLKN